MGLGHPFQSGLLPKLNEPVSDSLQQCCFSSRSLPASLTLQGVFCSQITSLLQLPACADTAERNEWSSSGCLMPRCSFQTARACINSWNATWTCSRFTSWGFSQQEYSFGWLVVRPLCPSQDWGWDLWILTPTAVLILKLHLPASHEWFALIRLEQPVFSCAPEDAIFNTSINCLFIKGAGRSTPLWLPWFCDAVAVFLKYKLFWMRWNSQVLKLNRYACVMMANL